MATPANAQERLVEISFTPTARAQVALWIESEDGEFMDTLRLTESVSVRGIGNRPGALQMNSGFRWPYGRREGVLPVWGHRRADAEGNQAFRRVIFQDRSSEGYASRTSSDASRDDYFCLSFNQDTTRRDALDAVTCASQFNSDKGRYIASGDSGYAEPYQEGASERMRQLSMTSVYPPRRDIPARSGDDHGDVANFDGDARDVMPELDAVTMATPAADVVQNIQFTVPSDWPDGNYIVWLEVNVEGDYNSSYSDVTHPTPQSERWDFWAKTYGYPYRGQPSVVYQVPFVLSSEGGDYQVRTPAGFGALEGEDGNLRPIDGTISDDPTMAPGSGADRLRVMAGDNRVSVHVVPTSVCLGEDPPPECFSECDDRRPCGDGFVCGDGGTCVGVCDVEAAPSVIPAISMEHDEDIYHAHHWATVRFTVPESERALTRYELRVSGEPIVDEASFLRARPAKEANLDTVELTVPVEGMPGDQIEVSIGQLTPETRFYVALRAVDMCNSAGEFAVADLQTKEIHFTTVSPCFVATAAYGSPMADEIGALRRFRDRHLLNNGLGRAFVDAYYEHGPKAAAIIAEDEDLRAVTRALLTPVVAIADLLAR